MCKIKSGLIFKNRVVVAPAYNDSHSCLLERMGIEDSYINAEKIFVRVELSPQNGDLTDGVDDWKYKVDQDITPGWYNVDKEKYEEEFRDAVKAWMAEKTVNVCGKNWSHFKDGDREYFVLNDIIAKCIFGRNNNYNGSNLQKVIKESGLYAKVVEEFGDRLIPITSNLTSLDGFKDYGRIGGDLIAELDFGTYRDNRENIVDLGKTFWLANPYSTDKGYGNWMSLFVDEYGSIKCYGSGTMDGVRPFFILKSE